METDMYGATNLRGRWRRLAVIGIAATMALGVSACGGDEDSAGGSGSSAGADKDGKASAKPSAPGAPDEAQLTAASFTDGEKVGKYTASEYVLDGPLGDAYTAAPAGCQPLVSLAGEAADPDPAAQVQRKVDVPDEMLGLTVDVTLRSYANGGAATVMKALDKAGRDCAGGFTEERAVAAAKYLKAEPVKAPAFAAEADESKAYRFTILDVKGKEKLYEYLTVVRSGSTTLAFRAEITSTKDVGGVPPEVMAAQWAKFRAAKV
ncbi:hypothetical protein ACIBI8_26750 [Streptomyces sp. NPDC050529]|uniref:hypothetical protein n=1 Tax=unclassified Streptomyces TaxID=2593676 RepID=UPI002DD859DE|nr:hypothetical protein [Streptomyces sp. NBC_01022]MEE4490618.1 hypothetical protein [Streptomyces sp. BE230]WRZ84884.1 hypothetical protein OG316_33780 [Streptomyces sp. NBC_01022]